MIQSLSNFIFQNRSAVHGAVAIGLAIALYGVLSFVTPAQAQTDSSAPTPRRPTANLITTTTITPSQVTGVLSPTHTTLLQPLPSRITHLSVEEGLTNNDITAILQDRQGFLWIGTRDGLNRYDGYTIVTYRHEPDNPNSLPRNEIRALFEDRDGMLWIATNDGGVTRYDPRLERFETLRHEPDNEQSLGGNLIFSIHQTPDGQLWFGGPSISGLTRFDPVTATFVHYRRAEPNALTDDPTYPRGAIMQMYTDAQGTLWLLTETALARFDPSADRFHVYAIPREQAASSFLRTALTDVNGRFLVGGGDGLRWFEPTTGHFTRIADTPEHVEVLHRDTGGVIWVGRRSGLYQFDPTTQRTRLIYRRDAANESSLTDSNITSLLSGQNGLLWVGTRQGGLNRLDPQQQQFTRYAFGTETRPAMPGAAVQAVVEGRAGELWVVDSHNLYRLRQQEQVTATAVMPAGPSPFPNEPFAVTVYPLPAIEARSETGGSPIGRLLFDHRGHLWLSLLGTDVFEFNPETETFTAYALISGPPQPGPPANVNAMIEDEMHNLWFAVSFTGLYRLDATRQELTAIRYRGRPDFFTDTPDNIASAAVVALASDGQGTLWIGYHDGTLSQFVPAANRFTHYPSRSVLLSGSRPPNAGPPACPECPLPPNGRPPAAASAPPTGTLPARPPSPEEIAAANPSGWIEALHWDNAANLLWIGERNGLVRFDPTTAEFTHYGADAGLANTFIVSIAQDQQGNLWLGTQHGLIYFDPVLARAYNYTTADGLQGNQFGRLAAMRRADGQLFFGGPTGMTSFDPKRVVNPINPVTEVPVVLTTMRLYNTPVTVRVDSPLNEALWATDMLTLQPEHQVVSFEFAALNFAAPNQNHYRYRLEGLESSWNEVPDDRRFATYTSLHPGTYTFRVQGGDSNGDWYSPGTTLMVQVLPRWWQTLWFRLLSICSVMGALFGGYRYRTHAIAARNRLLEKQVAERTAALQESEERFRGLSTSAFEAILIHQGGTIVDANEAATRLFGYAHETLVGLPITALLQPLLPATAADSARADAPDPYEMEGVQADGRIIPLEVHMRTIPYQGQEALVMALRDLTERRATERQRQQLAALAERERIGRDLHDDLGQVIGYIGMQAQTAQELLKQERAVQAQSTLQELAEAAQSAHSSVRQFILGIRNGRDQTPTLDLFTALDLYLDQVRERHGVTVQVSLPEELPDQLLSTQVETQLLRIIQEAVANVCKHAGVDTARIVFLLQPDELQVMISDEGRGFAIDPSSQTAADQATFAHESRITHHVSRLPSPLPSLHFGLDIMRERAEGVGGKVEIRSTPGHGTQILVTMPRRLDLLPQEELRGLRVLLADDHPLYREGLRNMLSVRGIHVVGIAEDGHEAEQLAHQLLPDLILMDIEMPNCDGVAATKAIKAALPAIKIVMLTVAAGTDLLLTALKNGASGYLLKNLATDQFFALLSEVLQGETVLSPKLMTSMVSTLTSDQVATEGQNGSGQEAPSQAAGPDRAAVNTQIQQLTNRQREVLDLIVQGLTNKEIARELHITERTVKYHVGLILEQMDAQSRYDLIYLTQSVAGLATNGHQEK